MVAERLSALAHSRLGSRLANASLSQKLVMPLVAMGIVVAMTARYAISDNATESIEALGVELLAQKSMSLLLIQDDTTKALLIDPTKLGEIAERKINAYDQNQAILKEMADKSRSPTLKQIIAEMNELDQAQLRPLDTKILELMMEDIEKARKEYFSAYEPIRSRYESLVTKIDDEARKEVAAARLVAEKKNQISFLQIAGVLVLGTVLVGLVIFVVSRRIAKWLHLLQDVSRKTVATSQEVSEYSNELAESTSHQTQAVNNTVSAIARMSTLLTQTSARTIDAKGLSETVSTKTGEGEFIMNDLTRSMDAIAQANEELQRITEIMATIVEKTSVINDIAFKTQILSVNASIEAAQAGDLGRGFAIIADEMGALATSSGQSAGEITTLLTDSKRQVSEIVHATNDKVGRGQKTSVEARQAFQEISTIMHDISASVDEIGNATEKQSDGIRLANGAMDKMKEAIQGTSALVRKSIGIADALTKRADRLSEIQAGMQSLVLGEAKPGQVRVKRISDVDRLLSDASPGAPSV